MPESTWVRVGIDRGVAHVILARPEKKNALNRQLADELSSAVRMLGEREEVAVIALSADGPDFCAGADLESIGMMVDATTSEHEEDALALANVFLALRRVPQPTVAIVRGRALAGGAGLASACDIVLAHPESQFGYTEVRLGFVPAMVVALLVPIVGERTAFELCATGRLFGAAEAHFLGIVSRVLEASNFDAEVATYLATLAGYSNTSLRATKALLYEARWRSLEAGLHHGAKVNAAVRSTPEFRAGLRQFLDRKRDRKA